ncbi:MAG: aldo/keto reductase [Solobacterium sp.]|nr:aldo/keto reductase [Solobacterium sp.]
MILQETYELNNGVKIPKVGLGTWQIKDGIEEVIKNAVEVGYRLIDTAQAYGNEEGIGKGIQECGIPREEIFLETKLHATKKDYFSAKQAIDESLVRLDVDYIDLMIIHSPQPWEEVNQSEERYYKGNVEAYHALEDAYKEGKLRAIGISNFLNSDTQNILDHCSIIPMANQILTHISNTKLDIIKFNQERNIFIQAYSPIAHGEILKNEKIIEMANKYNVSVPQLCLRYVIELGAIPIMKTANKDHMISNAQLDFHITDEDMTILNDFDPIQDYGASSKFPCFGGKKPTY